MVTQEFAFHGQINFWRLSSEDSWNIQVQPAEGGTQSGTISDKGHELISELLEDTDQPLTSCENRPYPATITVNGEEYIYKNTIPESNGLDGVASYVANSLPHRKYEVRKCEEGHFAGGWVVYAGPRKTRSKDDVLDELQDNLE